MHMRVVHVIKSSLDVCYVLCEFIYWESTNDEHAIVKNKKKDVTVASRHLTFAKLHRPMKVAAKA